MELLNIKYETFKKQQEELKESRINLKKKLKLKPAVHEPFVKKTGNQKKRKKIKKQRKVETIRSYKRYIVSDLWLKRKNRYWRKHGKKCAICGRTKYVTLHHKVYSGIYGDEPDSHLVALCYGHHHEFHQNFETKQNMKKETDLFIHEMKQGIHLKREIDAMDEFIKNIR